MAASSGAAPVFFLISIFLIILFLFIAFYNKIIKPKINSLFYKRNIVSVGFSLCCLIILFIPIRGGFTQMPLSQSGVYFSKKLFANHAAINVPWNVMHSIFNENSGNKNPYQYLDDNTAKKYVDSIYKNPAIIATSLFSTPKPNIIFLILESYTSKFIGCLGGEKGVTPNIDSIANNGLLFTNIYASGYRSEKGLVALLSGYPSQPATSIILTPSKTEKLPHFNLNLKNLGYNSAFYYGGEIEFANIKSYLFNAGYDRLVSKIDFNKNEYNSKWGVHDHILLNRFFNDIQKEKQHFFYTLFTLSSHEPYDIPIAKKFLGEDETTKFKNAFYYTDQAIGDFIANAQKQPWWNSTLIIITADHGHRLPGDDPGYAASKFKIPLIFSGGALKLKHKIINTIGSQTDVAATVLQQMNVSTEKYKWSKNLFDSSKQFAFYVFNDGFGYVTKNGVITFDNISKKIISQDKNIVEEEINFGKAYMQRSFYDFLHR